LIQVIQFAIVTVFGQVASCSRRWQKGAEKIDQLEADIELTLAETAQLLRLTHVMCYASVQGRTVDNRILLLDLAHRHFRLRTLNVGMSRATRGRVRAPGNARTRYVLLDQRRRYRGPPRPRRLSRGADSDGEDAEWRADSNNSDENERAMAEPPAPQAQSRCRSLWEALGQARSGEARIALQKRGFFAPSVQLLREHFFKFQSSRQVFRRPPKVHGTPASPRRSTTDGWPT
jgi:hypothetical protein